MSDPHTGLAISGFDPVAYFSDAHPVIGRANLEHRAEGATWRFANEGNRAAFADAPDVYAPQFGGYDPVAIARGASVAGHPEIWLVSERKLFLFYSAEARDAFAAAPQPADQGSVFCTVSQRRSAAPMKRCGARGITPRQE